MTLSTGNCIPFYNGGEGVVVLMMIVRKRVVVGGGYGRRVVLNLVRKRVVVCGGCVDGVGEEKGGSGYGGGGGGFC